MTLLIPDPRQSTVSTDLQTQSSGQMNGEPVVMVPVDGDDVVILRLTSRPVTVVGRVVETDGADAVTVAHGQLSSDNPIKMISAA